MKAVVVVSLEDAGGDRCVDLIREGAAWFWVECRRDPEDAHGWRRLHPPRGAFPDRAGALADARADVGWLSEAPG
ncbi:hypothetical protein [Jannaschia seohaensis]|uniref:Uncharacterized protein n=1 Tax=Jannaschia seohaensis TaxID=475081 RepID=A0A2Y9C1N2_9RHOB|nr:hypothetical protein [Jannaschia seohaensis]PWJ16976.1 hypothetical protein BCF38_10789 [Jannaschia seohaensis]SSA48262.1 hypothetical protein SAMN05421539_10789 [Jannaschia seohaensis]